MAYEGTASRKRPQNFEELSGQDFAASTLMSSLSENKIAHAYLFSGPRGVGKTSAARILAKALNCDEGPAASPCGICPSCHEISSGNALDVIEIDGASNTSVNDVREIKHEVLFAPNSSRYKVYIIDEVHMLSNSAFNALLKTIEEPPPYIVFIFATTEGHKVPATIRSRCQQFHFQLIPLETIQNRVAEAAQELEISIEEEALFWIAKEATGSLRDSYTLFDQIAAFSQGEITMQKILDKLGLVGTETISMLTEMLARGETSQALTAVESVLAGGISVEQFTIDLTEYFRSLLFLKLGITRESLLGTRSGNFPQTVIDGFSLVQIETAVDMLLNLFRTIRYSISQRYELELLISRLSQLPRRMTPEQLYQNLADLKHAVTSSGPSLPEASAAPKPDAPAQQAPEKKGSKILTEADIAHLLKAMKRDRPTLAALLEHSTWNFSGTELTFHFDTAYGADRARKEAPHIAEALSKIAEKPISVGILNPNAEESAEHNRKNPAVEMVQHLFRGEIVSGGSNEST